MIDLTSINEWQRLDPVLQIPQPWLTFPALDEINSWDLSYKTVLEIGGGASTVWWNRKAKEVVTIENNNEYFTALVPHIGINSFMTTDKGWLYHRPFDIVIIDNDGDRDDYILNGLKHLKYNGRFIIDNWCQKSVDWQPSQEIQDLLLSYKHKIFKQPNHPDWQTIIVYL